MVEYTILIPAYNEADVLGRVLQEFGQPAGCREIIVVDDGSTDDTADVARQHGARTISHASNRGYGAALKTGIQAVNTDFLICADGDGQHRLDDVLQIARQIGNHDMVVGVRRKGARRDWMRLPGKIVLQWFADILTDKRIPDLNSGMRSFRLSTIEKYIHLMPDGFSFSTTSSIAMLRMGHSVHYVPIDVHQRDGRKSTVQIFRDGFRVIMLILNLTVLFNPMRVFIPLAFLLMLGSLGYFIGYSILVRVHITASMVMLFITGVLIFMLGIICEQVSAIRREIHK